MRLGNQFRSWWRATVQRSRLENELDTELQFHLESYAEELTRNGLPPEEALRRARLEFGGMETAKQECREASRANLLETLIQDLRYGIRMMLRTPELTITAVIVLALGIGANSAIFSVVNAVLLRPLPFDQPQRLMQIWHRPPPASFPGIPIFAVSPANFIDWRSQNDSFEGMSAYGFGKYTLSGSGRPEVIQMVAVTNGFFSILHAQPMLGRLFAGEEDQPGREHEVILSYGEWRSRFGADPEIVGRTLELNSQAFTVVGVMGPTFEFPISTDPDGRAQMWKPLAWTDRERAIRDNHNYAVVARLKPRVTLKQAQAELDAISNQLALRYPNDDKGWGAIAIPLRDDLVGDVRPALLILLGAVALVLLIACANVANLMLSKALSRRKEMAVRAALGANRRRLVQQALSETVLLALAGGALGLIFAHYGVIFIVKFLAQRLPRSSEIAVDGWVLTFTLGVSLATGIAAGLLPALRMSKTNVNEALKQGLGRIASDSGGSRTRNVLVVCEVALSLMLLVGAGLLIHSLWMLRSTNPGFDPHDVVTMSLSIPPAKFAGPTQQIAYFGRVLERVRTLPAVQSAGLIDTLPVSNDGSHEPIAIEGHPAVPMADMPEVDVRLVSPGYLRAMHIPLLNGRDVDDSDAAGRPGVVLISESMAKSFWPNQDPVGQHITLYFYPDLPRTVVGVVADVKNATNGMQPEPTLYLCLGQLSVLRGEDWRSFGMNLAVRTNATPLSVVPAITNALREVDAEIPVLHIQTMDDSVSASLSPQRFTMLLLAAFAGLALILAVVGIYSVMSYSVSRRTNEIGIRVALGASRGHVLRLVVRQGLMLALIGSAIGITGALLLSRVMRSQLYGVQPTDPVTFLSVAGLLMVVVLAASYIPARRAIRVDPIVALRYE